MSSGPRIVVLGNSNVDLTSYVARSPEEGETVLAESFVIGMGGKGANQAVAASRAGGSVAFIGSIGRDSFGQLTLESLSQEGLNLDRLVQTDSPTGVATISVDHSGANRITVFLGASADLTKESVTDAVGHFSSAHIAVSQMEIDQALVLAGLREARAHQMTTVLNTAPYSRCSDELLECVDWLIANEVEAEALLKDAGIDARLDLPAHDLLGVLPQWAEAIGCHLVITLGEHGAIGCFRGEPPFHAEAPAVKAVDTVGAGDCFVGYFARFLDSGSPWQGALIAAVHAAADSVTAPGAQSSYPSAQTAAKYAALAEWQGNK